MIAFKHYRSGDLYGIHYRIPAGESLPEHAHDRSTEHNIVVLKGYVRLLVGDKTAHLFQGDFHDFDGTRRHLITAVNDSEVLNLFLHGMPAGYDKLPSHEREGFLQ